MSFKRLQRALFRTMAAVVALAILFCIGLYGYRTMFGYTYDSSLSDEDLAASVTADENITNIALFGLDTREGDKQSHSDCMMIVTVDNTRGKIKLISLMRDSLVDIDGYGEDKLNAAYFRGGPSLAIRTINENFGTDIKDYVAVDFEQLVQIVDAIGGVDYDVPFRMQYSDPSQHLEIDLQPGMQHLTGKQTVEFLRWRHNNDYSKQYVNGDEGRVENQQKFLKELARQVLQVKNASKIPKIAEAVSKNVKTDFTTGELLWMGKQALQIDNANLKFYTLPGYGAMSYAGSDPYKYSFFFPKEKETLELVNKYFNPYEEPITKLDMVTGPAESSSSGYSGGVSAGEDEDVWGDTGGGYYYEDDSDYSGGESGGDYSGGETGGETGGEGGGTVDPEA